MINKAGKYMYNQYINKIKEGINIILKINKGYTCNEK